MKDFKEVFNKWLSDLIKNDFDEINKLSSLLKLNVEEFFNHFLSRRKDDCCGTEIITEIFDDFIFYVSMRFQDPINKHLPIAGYNIYKEPTYGLYINLKYDSEFFFSKEDKRDLKRVFKKFTLSQKKELMQNHIFSYIINQTKFKIFSKKEIRCLKLRDIDEHSEITKE